MSEPFSCKNNLTFDGYDHDIYTQKIFVNHIYS